MFSIIIALVALISSMLQLLLQYFSYSKKPKVKIFEDRILFCGGVQEEVVVLYIRNYRTHNIDLNTISFCNGEDAIVLRDMEFLNINLPSNSTKQITIKKEFYFYQIEHGYDIIECSFSDGSKVKTKHHNKQNSSGENLKLIGNVLFFWLCLGAILCFVVELIN